MKKLLNIAIILAMCTICTSVMAQKQQEEYLGLPGDNLNLYAVMKLFQESETLESFERNLNDENLRINNLDLNGDNFIDYIKVTDYPDRDVHNIVLQVAINKSENQDVAVFTVQRLNNGQVQIQLIGDEALYGRNYIIEPNFDDQYANQTPNPGYSGNVTVVRTTGYEIAAWPLIRFIYLPNYVVWHSAWHWNYYPTYWHPWTPYYWHYYSGYHYNWYHDYYSHYHRYDHPRYNHWDDFYYSSRRSQSPFVSERIKTGNYKTTYSHPEQHKQGEALYARTNNDHKNFSSWRDDSNPAKSATRQIKDFNAKPSVRPVNAGHNSSATSQGNSHNSFSERRSAASPKHEQGAIQSRPAPQKASKAESAPSRRSNNQSQAAKSSKGSGSKKSSETEKDSHRR